MTRLQRPVLLAASAAILLSTAANAAPIEPAADSAAQRKALQALTTCLAEARPRWARQTLALPYLSQPQANVAAEALTGRDNCVAGSDAEVTFRTSSLVGNLAEHFVRADVDKTDSKRLKRGLIRAYAAQRHRRLCIVRHGPQSGRGAGARHQRARQRRGNDGSAPVRQPVEECTNTGEQLKVDVQALRALVSTALYRGITATLGKN
jgi:hypothetical protein